MRSADTFSAIWLIVVLELWMEAWDEARLAPLYESIAECLAQEPGTIEHAIKQTAVTTAQLGLGSLNLAVASCLAIRSLCLRRAAS